jgi:hypothetical protein
MQNLEKVAFGRAKVSNLFGGAVRARPLLPIANVCGILLF